MDKGIFVNQFELSSTRHCFKLLTCLGFNLSLQFCPSRVSAMNPFTPTFDKPLAFSRFFASVFNEKVAHSAPLQCEVPTNKLRDLSLSLSDVRYLLECSDDSNAVVADGITSFLLYQCSNILCTPVFELFNWTLKNQHWPDIWKQANVTPLHKSGEHIDIANYRPISVLPKLSLILKRILFNYIYPKVRHLIRLVKKHGFLNSRSTVSQKNTYLDAVHSSRHTNFSAVFVYFDIRKAFDSVPHNKLLSKLANFGFDSEFLHLLHSYLTNRSQCVKIYQTLSSPLPVTSGVPQGIVLALCFFNFLLTILPIMWRTVLLTLSLTISKVSALLPIRLCKMISTHLMTGVTLTVSNSTQQNVKISVLEAMMSLHNFCLGPNICRLSIRSKIWILLYPALYHGKLMLNQNFLNAIEFSAS